MNDLCAMTLGFVFMLLFMTSVSDSKYSKPYGYVILGLPAAAFVYVTCFDTIFHEYGSAAPAAACIIGFGVAEFALKLFVKRARPTWTSVWFSIQTAVYAGSIILNSVCEVIFRSEFGERYNFITAEQSRSIRPRENGTTDKMQNAEFKMQN